MSDKVMFVYFYEGTPRILEGKDRRPLEFYDNPDGFRVYVSDDMNTVGAICTVNKDRYKLFRSKGFKVRDLRPNGTSGFIDVESWNYRVTTIDTRQLDDNGERIFAKKIEWYVHGPSEIMEPTEANITGKKASSEPAVYAELRAARIRIDALEHENSVLSQQVEQLKSDIAMLNSLIDMGQPDGQTEPAAQTEPVEPVEQTEPVEPVAQTEPAEPEPAARTESEQIVITDAKPKSKLRGRPKV